MSLLVSERVGGKERERMICFFGEKRVDLFCGIRNREREKERKRERKGKERKGKERKGKEEKRKKGKRKEMDGKKKGKE